MVIVMGLIMVANDSARAVFNDGMPIRIAAAFRLSMAVVQSPSLRTKLDLRAWDQLLRRCA